MLKVGILLGDDIGLEVVPEAVKVMQAAAAKTGLPLDWRPLPIGRKSHEATGLTMPQSTVDAVATLDGWLMGPIGHSMYPRNDPTWAKPDFRKRFDLFASVKPVKSYANIESLHKGVDIVFQRTSKLSQRDCGELTEFIYAWGSEHGVKFAAPEDAHA